MWSKVNSLIQDEPSRKAPAGTASGSDEHEAYLIMDARSQIASMGNQVLGKGTENAANYTGSKLVFLNIDNIHTLRAAFQKLCALAKPEACDAQADFGKAVADTGWLKQVQSVLQSSLALADALHEERRSVLTHCSDGWDRTSQMCSLAMLLLDPYYRTMEGFAVLIEKEWLAFGHKFAERVGNEPLTESSARSEELSPVFGLWMDCVWQVMLQNPLAFEFNERFVVAILDHTTSGRFGTFLGNCERERRSEGCHVQTPSVWDVLLSDPALRNPAFVGERGGVSDRLAVSTAPKALRLWEALYFRFDESFSASTPHALRDTVPGGAGPLPKFV